MLIVVLLVVAILFSVASIAVTLGVKDNFGFAKDNSEMYQGSSCGNLHIEILPSGGKK